MSNRPEVVAALVAAHATDNAAFALAAVEFESSPTDDEKAEAHRQAVDAGNAELRRLGGLPDER